MPNFLYISDVFCPWCYGFAPVMRRLAAEHPEWPVRVLHGRLVEEPVTLARMVAASPTLPAFFARLADTTGQRVNDVFLHRPAQSDLPACSLSAAQLLAALRRLAPGSALRQLEALQAAYYRDGRDVLAAVTQRELAAAFGVDQERLARALGDPSLHAAAREENAEAEALMGELALYPTLCLETEDGGRLLLARGYAPYEEVAARLEALTAGLPVSSRPGSPPAPACGSGRHCPL